MVKTLVDGGASTEVRDKVLDFHAFYFFLLILFLKMKDNMTPYDHAVAQKRGSVVAFLSPVSRNKPPQNM